MEAAKKVVDPATLAYFTDDHPTGVLAQRYLFVGEDNTPDNFMFSIAENRGHFHMVRHRHSFDQFRFGIEGDLEMGNGRKLREGCLGYFPEGTPYGPQDDQAGPVTLVLQFGGSSGYGYLSPQQYRDGRAALKKIGRFEGSVFIREMPDGTVRKTLASTRSGKRCSGPRCSCPRRATTSRSSSIRGVPVGAGRRRTGRAAQAIGHLQRARGESGPVAGRARRLADPRER